MNDITFSAKFALCHRDAKLPTKRACDAMYDIYAAFDEEYIEIAPHSTALVPTGLKSTFPNAFCAVVHERGSNTKSCSITQAGIIDAGYKGQWFIAIYNGNDVPLFISKYTNEVEKIENTAVIIPYSKAIAQFTFQRVPEVVIQQVDEDYIDNLDTERGAGCLGSSGK